MRRYIRINITPTTENKKLSTSDVLAFIGLLFTFIGVVFGYWGNELSKLSIKQSDAISKQQQQIKGFESLLKLTKSEIAILSKQNSLLASQLIISNNFLAYQKNNIKLSYKSNLANLINSENELNLLLWQPYSHSNKLAEWNNLERDSFIISSKRILQNEMSNTFLIQNTKLYSKWVSVFDSLTRYGLDKHFYPTKEKEFILWDKPDTISESQKNTALVDKSWRSAYKSVGDLWQDLYNFLNQYRGGNFDFNK